MYNIHKGWGKGEGGGKGRGGGRGGERVAIWLVKWCIAIVCACTLEKYREVLATACIIVAWPSTAPFS